MVPAACAILCCRSRRPAPGACRRPWACCAARRGAGLRLLCARDLVLPAPRPGRRHQRLGHRPRRGRDRHLAPFAFPLLHGAPPGTGRQFVSDLLLVAGMAWSVWSLRFLGRNVSVLAQARDVVDRGPYRWVRHPLYTGEIVSSLGVAIARTAGGGPPPGWRSARLRCTARCGRSRCCCRPCPDTSVTAPHRGPVARPVLALGGVGGGGEGGGEREEAGR